MLEVNKILLFVSFTFKTRKFIKNFIRFKIFVDIHFELVIIEKMILMINFIKLYELQKAHLDLAKSH